MGRIDSFSRVPWMMTKIVLSLWSSAIDHALFCVVVGGFWVFLETAQGHNPGWSLGITAVASWGAHALLGRRRSRTTGAATGAISVMTWLIIGVTVCAGFWTKALTIFKHGWWSAYVAAAAGAGTLHDCRRHQFSGSQLLIAVNRYLLTEQRLKVAQFSQIMKMIITFVLRWSWSLCSGFFFPWLRWSSLSTPLGD